MKKDSIKKRSIELGKSWDKWLKKLREELAAKDNIADAELEPTEADISSVETINMTVPMPEPETPDKETA